MVSEQNGSTAATDILFIADKNVAAHFISAKQS